MIHKSVKRSSDRQKRREAEIIRRKIEKENSNRQKEKKAKEEEIEKIRRKIEKEKRAKEEVDALSKDYDLKYNKVAGYVSYKNLNMQLGNPETKHQIPTIKKMKGNRSWKSNYGCYSSIQKNGFCIIKIMDQTIRDKIDELHQIMSASDFSERSKYTKKVFNSIAFDNSEKILKQSDEEFKMDGGRNSILVHELPKGYGGKELSIEIGEFIRVEVLKNTDQNIEETSMKTHAANKKPGMVLTWLETQGPVKGHKVMSQRFYFFVFKHRFKVILCIDYIFPGSRSAATFRRTIR